MNLYPSTVQRVANSFQRFICSPGQSVSQPILAGRTRATRRLEPGAFGLQRRWFGSRFPRLFFYPPPGLGDARTSRLAGPSRAADTPPAAAHEVSSRSTRRDRLPLLGVGLGTQT